MASDHMDAVRELLKTAINTIENTPESDNYQNVRLPPPQSGGGQNFTPPPAGGRDGGGMDPWQSSVESRLGSLERRLERVDDGLGNVETGLATLTERVAHLPTTTKLYTAAGAIIVALTAAITFSEKLHGLVH